MQYWKKNLGKEFNKIETRFTKLKYVHLYENFSEKNYNKYLSSDQVSVSEHVKDRENFSQKKPKLMLYSRVKEMARESLVDSFLDFNWTIKWKNYQNLDQYQLLI